MATDDQPLNVVPDAVTAVGRRAYDIAQQLKSGSIALDREVQALFDTWKGSAADAYREGWDDMQDGAMKAWDALTDLASRLGVSASTLRDQDTSNAAPISSLQLD
ncbi:WXG100 family type VII secretion target [Nocardia farcinica]|uniref:ESAT-6-like protein n=1 Tax=Nocardia farcinica TaxID=37329 RepID=A0A0H5P1J3_NOCFR|nr:WXG100 family type VII secretion target [Nocardia farcinica]AXK87194.1 WXG100 family type VII secretion target [Nocardia farcinica]MBA4856995.1 WXG100 family type VII secretion target [Nocardia farcinica]MBC9815470.1 WXG100 family type VII secretion target [Nocardia farcinica]CRY81174.1 WXG100 family type VII secretion target [Nocardia farcinica]SIT11604.1 WXG100 family type VII secretion target [Nocardia farcinica]